MTLVATLLIGGGILFIASAIDDVSILTTFQNIINNKPVFTGATTSQTSATIPIPSSKGSTPPTTLL